MAIKRKYDDACGAAHALNLIGERWALIVVRELVLGPKRFTDLRAGIPGISPNVLSQRLDELESVGVARRRKLDPPAGSWVYELTEWGYELEPIIRELGRWGARSPSLPRDADISVDSLILSLRTMFQPHAAEGVEAEYELRLGDYRFRLRVSQGEFEAVRGGADRPDATIRSAPNVLAAVVYDGHDLDAAIAAGEVEIDGDRAAVERLLTLFALPERAVVG